MVEFRFPGTCAVDFDADDLKLLAQVAAMPGIRSLMIGRVGDLICVDWSIRPGDDGEEWDDWSISRHSLSECLWEVLAETHTRSPKVGPAP